MKNYHQLFTFATKARGNAHVPYSHFAVGAAIEDENGNFHAGCNVENVSFPCGTCAETGAIAAMTAAGGKKIRRILIVAGGDRLISPCGACRQRILEFSLPETEVLLADTEGVKKVLSVGELLPGAFKEFSHD